MQRLRVSGFAGLIALSGLWVAAGGCTTVTVEKPAEAPKVEERPAAAQAPKADDEEQQAQRSGAADKALDAWCSIPREQRAFPRIQAEARASFSLGPAECADQGFEPCAFSLFAAGSSVASQQQQQQQRGLDKGVAAQREQRGRQAQRTFLVSSFSDVRCRLEFESGGDACCACGVQ